MNEKEITIRNQIEQLTAIADALENISREWDIPSSISLSLNLVLEELVTNIIFYGYSDTNEHTILIRLSYREGLIQMTIEDDAMAFNPLSSAKPDINSPIGERKIGGLGIHFVRNIMDEISYERSGNRNIVKMSKRVGLKH